jgi:hypothetical protein
MGQSPKDVRLELMPLIELLARLAYEAIKRGEYAAGSRSVSDQQSAK